MGSMRLFPIVLGFLVALPACAERLSDVRPTPAAVAAAASLPSGLCHEIPVERSFCTALTLEMPKTTLRLAIADTPERRANGLMGARDVPAGEGMLFVFPEAVDAHHEFWMKDTIVPLDMIYIRTDGTVSAIFAAVPASMPGAPEGRIARRQAVGKYVIEVRAGGAAVSGVRVGSQLDMPVTVTR